MSDLPEGWVRLHPLSPLAKGGRALAAAAVAFGPQQLHAGGTQWQQLLVDGAVALAIIVAGIVSWLVTRWRVADGELQLETGLFRRQSIRVPLTRVQAVDVVRPLVARVLGMSELRLVLAGGGNGKARLSFLPEDRAVEVRAQLLAVGAGLAGDTPEAPEQPLASVPNTRLIASTFASAPAIVLVLLLAVGGGVAVVAGVGSIVGGGLVGLLSAGSVLARRVNAEFSFRISGSPDGLRLHSGLLQTRHETIRPGRIQGVRLVEPLLWRPFGWVRLEVDVAQQSEHEIGEENEGQLTRALLPVGTRAEADRVLALVLPGATSHPPAGSAAPRRVRLKAPLSYRKLAMWQANGYLMARIGRVRSETVVVPLAKAQSIRWTQGPVQRRLDLATVRVDTAGRHWKAVARDRDATEARHLLATLPDLARLSRSAR